MFVGVEGGGGGCKGKENHHLRIFRVFQRAAKGGGKLRGVENIP